MRYDTELGYMPSYWAYLDDRCNSDPLEEAYGEENDDIEEGLTLEP